MTIFLRPGDKTKTAYNISLFILSKSITPNSISLYKETKAVQKLQLLLTFS